MSAAEAKATADALDLMVKLRADLPYKSKAWWALNNACCHLSDSFWSRIGGRTSKQKDAPVCGGRKAVRHA
jgi:hypothetical protein